MKTGERAGCQVQAWEPPLEIRAGGRLARLARSRGSGFSRAAGPSAEASRVCRPLDRAWQGSHACWEQRAQKAEVRGTGRVACLLRSFCFLLPGPLGSALQKWGRAAQPPSGAARPRPRSGSGDPPSPPLRVQAARSARPGPVCIVQPPALTALFQLGRSKWRGTFRNSSTSSCI